MDIRKFLELRLQSYSYCTGKVKVAMDMQAKGYITVGRMIHSIKLAQDNLEQELAEISQKADYEAAAEAELAGKSNTSS